MVEDNHKTVGGRRYRLKQLKKILPSDRISIEKHYPRFYQKCQKIHSLQQKSPLSDEDQLIQRSSDSPDHQRPPLDVDRGNRLEDGRGKFDDDRCSENEAVIIAVSKENLLNSQRGVASVDLDDKILEPEGLVAPMADHLEEMTLHRGCWLQATLSSQQRHEMGGHLQPPPQPQQQQQPNQGDQQQPKIVFIHRKTSNQQRSRADLAREVLEEFERQKQQLVRRCSTVEHTLNPLTFQRSTYQKSLPIFNRPSIIHLQSRRVS